MDRDRDRHRAREDRHRSSANSYPDSRNNHHHRSSRSEVERSDRHRSSRHRSPPKQRSRSPRLHSDPNRDRDRKYRDGLIGRDNKTDRERERERRHERIRRHEEDRHHRDRRDRDRRVCKDCWERKERHCNHHHKDRKDRRDEGGDKNKDVIMLSDSDEELQDVEIEDTDEDEEQEIERLRQQRRELLQKLFAVNNDNDASNSGFSSVQNSPKSLKDSTMSPQSAPNEDSQPFNSFEETIEEKRRRVGVSICEEENSKEEEQNGLKNDTDLEPPKVAETAVKKKPVDMFSDADIFADDISSTADSFNTKGIENPALLDNWDDAEGYYSKFGFIIFHQL